MKKIILIIMILLFLPLAFASTQSLGVFEQDTTVNLIQSCYGSTYSNITRVVYPDSTFAINGPTEMTKVGYEYNYDFVQANLTGQYLVYGNCDENGIGISWGYDFIVTKNGEMYQEGGFNIFVYILFIIASLGLFLTLFLTLAKLITYSETIYGVLVTWSFFILMIIVNYLANYQLSTFVTDLSSTFISVTAWTNVVLPLLGFIISYIVKSTQKKKPLTPMEIGGFKYG